MKIKVVDKIPAHNSKYISAASLTRQRNAAATYLQTVVRHTKKANARSSTFGFLPSRKLNAEKPKELALFQPTTRQCIITLNNSELLLSLTPIKINLGFK